MKVIFFQDHRVQQYSLVLAEKSLIGSSCQKKLIREEEDLIGEDTDLGETYVLIGRFDSNSKTVGRNKAKLAKELPRSEKSGAAEGEICSQSAERKKPKAMLIRSLGRPIRQKWFSTKYNDNILL